MDSALFTPQSIFLVLAAISLGSWLKGMTGLGLPMFAVPALATFISVEEAVVLMIIPSIASNTWLVASHRAHYPLLKQHRPFLIAGVIGALFGTWLLKNADDWWLRLLLAIWLGQYLLKNIIADKNGPELHVSPKIGAALGLFAGTAQGISGISAPVVAPYYHARQLAKQAYAFAMAASFLLFALSQLFAITGLQLFTPERIQLALLALLPTLLFTRLGIAHADKLPVELFNKLLLVIFLVMEIKLITDLLPI